MKRQTRRKSIRELMKHFERVHYKIFFVTICIASLGLLMIEAATYTNSGIYFFKRQLAMVIGGCLMMIVAAYVDVSALLYRFAKLIYVVGIALMFSLLTPLAVSSHGATRWINIAGFQLQPVEVVKISTIVMLAYILHKKESYHNSVMLTLLLWVVGAIPALLALSISADLSSALVILGITFLTTFCVMKTWLFHLGICGGVVGAVFLYLSYFAKHLPPPELLNEYSYRVARLAAWIKPADYPDAAYQTQMAMYAIGSGGWFGNGLAKIFLVIPEAENDFIFATMVHQMGIFGGIVLISLYMYLIYQIIRVSMNAPVLFQSILAMEIALHIGIQVIINIGVNVGLLPNTGIPLILMSYGGSALLCIMFELALCVSLSKKSVIRCAQREFRESDNNGSDLKKDVYEKNSRSV